MTTVDVTLRIGGVFATDRPGVICTVLASCIAVCMFDPVSRLGGMNQFMVPTMTRDDAGRLFGAGNVLPTRESVHSVPARNIAFIEGFVRDQGVEVLSRDLGDNLPPSTPDITQF